MSGAGSNLSCRRIHASGRRWIIGCTSLAVPWAGWTCAQPGGQRKRTISAGDAARAAICSDATGEHNDQGQALQNGAAILFSSTEDEGRRAARIFACASGQECCLFDPLFGRTLSSVG